MQRSDNQYELISVSADPAHTMYNRLVMQFNRRPFLCAVFRSFEIKHCPRIDRIARIPFRSDGYLTLSVAVDIRAAMQTLSFSVKFSAMTNRSQFGLRYQTN